MSSVTDKMREDIKETLRQSELKDEKLEQLVQMSLVTALSIIQNVIYENRYALCSCGSGREEHGQNCHYLQLMSKYSQG